MTNKQRGYVSFDGSDKTWNLRYTTNVLCRIEGHFGQPIGKLINIFQDEQNMSIQTIRSLFFFGLDGCDNEDQAGKIMDEVGFVKAGQLITEAFALAFPQDAKGGKQAEGK